MMEVFIKRHFFQRPVHFCISADDNGESLCSHPRLVPIRVIFFCCQDAECSSIRNWVERADVLLSSTVNVVQVSRIPSNRKYVLLGVVFLLLNHVDR